MVTLRGLKSERVRAFLTPGVPYQQNYGYSVVCPVCVRVRVHTCVRACVRWFRGAAAALIADTMAMVKQGALKKTKKIKLKIKVQAKVQDAKTSLASSRRASRPPCTRPGSGVYSGMLEEPEP